MNTIPKRRLDTLIPLAINVINELGIKKDGSISKTYHGYFSSFGADMITTSPLAAAIFCEDKTEKESAAKEDRSKVALGIYRLMQAEGRAATGKDGKSKLSEFLLSFKGSIPQQTVMDMMAASIALKIALRTFKKSE
jgi:hypothetical protein